MSATAPPVAPPRTLADQLRGWPDDRLAALLAARPDLGVPAPQDSAQLASRASTRASVVRALDQLTRLELLVLDGLAVLGGRGPADRLQAVVHAAPTPFAAALRRVRDLALVWGGDEDLRLVSAVAELLATTVSGLGPTASALLAAYGPERLGALLTDLGLRSTGDRSADADRVAAELGDLEAVARLRASVDHAARQLLDHLDSTGPTGTTEEATAVVRVATARTPVEQLLARGLLLPQDRRHVAVPREVGLALRGGRSTRDPGDEPPPVTTGERPARLVDSAAAGAAHELVHRVETLLEHLAERQPVVLRQGGLAKRDLRTLAGVLGVDERAAALHVEVAASAGLLGRGSGSGGDVVWLPTSEYDGWGAAPAADRWERLAAAWLTSPRLFGLVGGRLGDKPVNALAPELERVWVPDTRRAVLAELARLEPGRVLSDVASLVARLEWLRPRRPAGRADAVGWTLEEAAVLGVVGLGGLARHGRALLEGPGDAAAAVEPLLPAPVDHVLIQGDLTAVAPGPLEDALARDLAAVAQVESRGGATVYRFTPASVRHAFDLGWSALEVHEALARAVAEAGGRGEVPQALEYLVDDVARTFGRVRVGSAEAFLRSDDEAALTALVHDPRAAGLGLRRIAPTVVVSSTPLDVLLPRLRALGASPVVEGPDGVVHVARREPARAPASRPVGPPLEPPVPTAARAAATVSALRAGDRAAEVRPGSVARQSPAATLTVLREAAEIGATVWIGYVDKDGSALDRLVEPERVEGGWLRAFDQRSSQVRSFAVHRISSVRPV